MFGHSDSIATIAVSSRELVSRYSLWDEAAVLDTRSRNLEAVYERWRARLASLLLGYVYVIQRTTVLLINKDIECLLYVLITLLVLQKLLEDLDV